MIYDEDRIESAVLALLALFAAKDGHSWKGYDFEVMNRLHARGFIGDPVNRNKGVYLTKEGMQRGIELAKELFGATSAGS